MPNPDAAQSDRQLIIAWPGHQLTAPLTAPVLRLGRHPDGNDIVIEAPAVAPYHATLRLEADGYHLLDGQERDGQWVRSPNGLSCRGQPVVDEKLDNGEIVRIPGPAEDFVSLLYFDAAAASPGQRTQVSLTHEISLGRDPRNDLVINDPTASAFHATVTPLDQGHLLRDLRSASGTFVNGQRVTQHTLRPDDDILIGSVQLRYDGHHLALVDLRRAGIRLDGVSLRKQVPAARASAGDSGFKLLLSDVSLVIHPREFIAIVGGSGTGKSTLLDALNAFRPVNGRVLINGDDLYRNFDAYRQSIGYVPQDDIIHRELTVEEALRFVARLRLPPDTGPAEIEKRVETVLQQVAMSNRRTVLVRQLSGGQRKRISLAVELIAAPGILFLDEPTSGLDPGLDKRMMFTLRQVANAGTTVILVTHATDNIQDCDLVAFLAERGRLIFYGPPTEALTFFGVHDFAEIYHLVELEPDRWQQAFQASGFYAAYIERRLATTCPRCSEPLAPEQMICANCGYQRQSATTTAQAAPVPVARPTPWRAGLATFSRQTSILIERYVTIMLRDRRNLLFLLLQAPLIALLLFLVMKPGLFNQGLDVEVSDLAEMQKVLFVLACIAAWFGLINAVREIVKELPIYRRERFVNLGVAAYVTSKLVVLLALSIVQAGLLVAIVHLRGQFPAVGASGLPGVIEIFAAVLLVTFASTCLGLLLSAAVGREDRVMSLMPLFLIPQIVFAGVVFKLEGSARFVSWLTFSRWGIEALGATINLPELHRIASYVMPVEALVFPFDHSSAYLRQNLGILLALAVVCMALTVVALKRQDAR
ncbi:MAG: ATP-binding cassette domain-containing protein [Anaerolineae bacterium]|nr:ATP-binding cassette domain-containing protein [Anaerolineae bacterium]